MAAENKKETVVRAHVRSGTAIPSFTQFREVAKNKPTGGAAGRRTPPKSSLVSVASSPAYEMNATQWGDLIEKRQGLGPPDPSEARFSDGTLHVGKRQLVVSVTRVFTYLHDEPATETVERFPQEVASRDTYQIDVPEGAHVSYETIEAAFRERTQEEFTELIASGVYVAVDTESVVVQEWEVTPATNPDDVWSLQREIWGEGSIDHEARRSKRGG